MIFLTSCQSLVSKEQNLIIEKIPLRVTKSDQGTFLPYVKINIDGHDVDFLLDIGAVTSSVASDEFIKKYTSQGTSESKGASGIAKADDVILIQKMKMGLQVFSEIKIKRGHASLLGLDRLSNFVFQVDLKNQSLNLLKELPKDIKLLPIRRLRPGHVTIPLKFSGITVDALFDTGADSTVIDSKFVKQHQNLFKLVRTEEGTDANGVKIPSEVYSVESIQIGDLVLKNVEMATFEFGDHMTKSMEGSPLILGNNVILKAKWSFDLKQNLWALEF